MIIVGAWTDYIKNTQLRHEYGYIRVYCADMSSSNLCTSIPGQHHGGDRGGAHGDDDADARARRARGDSDGGAQNGRDGGREDGHQDEARAGARAGPAPGPDVRAAALREKIPGYRAGSKRFSLTATGDVLGLYHPSLTATFRSRGHIDGTRSRKKAGSDGTLIGSQHFSRHCQPCLDYVSAP